jgi:hypothetical protein
LENLEKIRCTNGPGPFTLPIDDNKSVSVTSSAGNYSKNLKAPHMWCQYFEKNNHNTADCIAISKFKRQKKALFEAKSGCVKNSLPFLFEEIDALKRHLKSEKTASNKKWKAESLLSNEINLITSIHKVQLSSWVSFLLIIKNSFQTRIIWNK